MGSLSSTRGICNLSEKVKSNNQPIPLELKKIILIIICIFSVSFHNVFFAILANILHVKPEEQARIEHLVVETRKLHFENQGSLCQEPDLNLLTPQMAYLNIAQIQNKLKIEENLMKVFENITDETLTTAARFV